MVVDDFRSTDARAIPFRTQIDTVGVADYVILIRMYNGYATLSSRFIGEGVKRK